MSSKRAAIWINRPFRNLKNFRFFSRKCHTLPDFLIIGAQKCGTTSLCSYLSQHPQIIEPAIKEIHYFDGGLDPKVDRFKEGQEFYRNFFPEKRHMLPKLKTFEASPLYLFNPLVPKRIHDLIPNVKLIVMLRNPSERAISHYAHEKKHGREKLSILEALLAEETRLSGVNEPGYHKSHSYIHHSYKSRGLYKQQIERYLEYFPKENILFINSEELFAKQSDILNQVYEFLEVRKDSFLIDSQPRNVTTNRLAVDPEVNRYLNDFFAPHNEQLYQLLNVRYSW